MHLRQRITDHVSFTCACACLYYMYCALPYSSSSHRRSSKGVAEGATVVIAVQLVQLLLLLTTEGTLP
jgi:hypothetical protein